MADYRRRAHRIVGNGVFGEGTDQASSFIARIAAK